MSASRRAYDAAACAWVRGAAPVYEALGAPVVEALGDVDGLRVLDVGAGTGAASTALARRGACVVALDTSVGMLAAVGGRVAVVATDGCHLPLVPAAFDHAVAAFVLSHVPEPDVLISEMSEVVSPGGCVVFGTFAAPVDDPTKRAIDTVLGSAGWRAPRWYVELKRCEEAVGDPGQLESLLAETELVDCEVTSHDVEVRFTQPRDAVAWRFGMAHIAPWMQGLSDVARRHITEAAIDAVTPVGLELQRRVLVARGTVPPDRRTDDVPEHACAAPASL